MTKSIALLNDEDFDRTIQGEGIGLFTLRSKGGLITQITNYGARVVSLWVPDRYGAYEDVVLGYETIDRYLNNSGERYLGAAIGRYANRIEKGRFSINNQHYYLDINNGQNALHGGFKGIDSVIWQVVEHSSQILVLSYTAKDGEGGFPGNLTITLTYFVNDDNALCLEYCATTDQATHVNLSHHSYFNLHGEGHGDVLDHLLTLNSGQFLPIDDHYIPTGEFMDVKSTPFDFITPKPIGAAIYDDHQQLQHGNGYDHCWVIDRKDTEMNWGATVYEEKSGRCLKVYTDQPGIQFYSSNWFSGETLGKYGKPHIQRGSFALETQKFPNTPNEESFPSTLLLPDETYIHRCIYAFSVEDT